MNKRIQELRGLAIIAVIFCHAYGVLEMSAGTDYWIYLLIREAVSFPVGVFIFLAGYFVNAENVLENPKYFLKIRGGRLLIPYFIWTVVYEVFYFLLRLRKGVISLSVGTLLLDILTGAAATPLYYIVVLMQFVLLTPMLVKTMKKHTVISKLLWFITPAYLVYIYLYNVVAGDNPRYYSLLFPAWFIFYYSGMVSRREGRRIAVKGVHIFIAYTVCFMEGVVLSVAGLNVKFAINQVKVSSQVFALLIAIYFTQREKESTHMGTVFATLGDCSYGVFYTHIIVLTVCQFLVDKILPSIWWLVDYILSAVLTIIGSWVLVTAAQRLIHSDKFKQALGLK